jgi:4-amino-4-deoxy-L-arabinose transferase-like glycosyltransferase
MHADPAGALNSSSLTAPPAKSHSRFVFTPKFFFLCLALLFAVHVAERVWITPLAYIDEGWQLVLAQHGALGYIGHPPLYTWLQILFFKTFGESILALALLKNALLFGMYSFTYLSARLLTRRHADAVFGTVCLMLIPQIGWECQRDLTHTVLLGTTTAATLFAFLALAEKPSAWRYMFLGVGAAAALLSKYNSALFMAAFAGAALMVPRYRAVMLDGRILLTALAGIVLAGPHFTWALHHWDSTFAEAHKLEETHFTTWTMAAVLLPWLMIKAFVPNMLPVAFAYALAKPQPWLRLRSDVARMLWWGTWIALALLGLGMLLAKAGGLRGRWFMPLFVCAPILLVAQLGTILLWLRRFVLALGIVGIVSVLAVLPLNAERQGEKKKELSTTTIAELTSAASQTLKSANLIIAENFWIGGNMRLRTGKPVMTPEATWPLAQEPKHISVVFNANHHTAVSPELRQFVTEWLHRPASLRVVYLSSTNNWQHTGMRLGVAVVE